MLGEIWREAIERLLPVIARKNSQEMRIELITGGVIDFWSLENIDSSRGRKYKRVVVDEAAMIAKLGEAWQNVIRPTLTDLLGDALFLSTPKGFNFFKVIYDFGMDTALPDWQSWQLPTVTNPYILPSEIESARLELPERVYRQEYLAEFLADGSFFVNVDNCATVDSEEAPIPGHIYIIGVDWARASGGDYTVYSIIDATARRQVSLSRLNGMDYDSQKNLLRRLHFEYNRADIIAEYNAMGGPLVEALQLEDLPVVGFTTTAATKHNIISGLHLGLERGELAILNDPHQLNELKSYEVRQRAGLPSYTAPEGQHDDTVIGLALAWYGVEYLPAELSVGRIS
jgi:hypothetical protein